MSLRPRKKPDDDKSGGDDVGSAEAVAPKLTLQPKKKPETETAASKTRAKPKLSLKSEPSPEPAPAPPVSPAPDQAPPPPPRLKPRLTAQPPADPATEARLESGDPAPPLVEHRDETNPAIDPAVQAALQKAKAEKPKLKLTVAESAKPAAPAKEPPQQSTGFVGDAPLSPPSPPPAPPQGAPADPSLPPPLPVVTDAAGNPATTPPLPPPAPSADDGDEDDETEAPARKRLRPEQRPIFKIAVFVVILMVLGAIGGGGYMVYTLFFSAPELNPYAAPLEAVAETPAPPSTDPGAAVSDAAKGALSMAGQLVDKARVAVAGHDEKAAEADAISAAFEAEAQAGTGTGSGASATGRSDPNPTAQSPTGLVPSSAFREWVNDAVISGVAETSNPRAFINGVLVKRGDTVDHGLGIVFDTIDPHENVLFFKDGSGAIVGKRY